MALRRLRRGSAIATAAVAAAVTLLSACGSSGTGSSGSDSSGSSNSGLSGSPVKVGLVAGLTGTGASIYGSVGDFAGVWEKYANANGGINGHPVQVVVSDSQSRGPAGLQAAKQLVQNDKVAAMIITDAVAEPAISTYLATTDVPLLGVIFEPGVAGTRTNTFAATTAVEHYLAGPMIAAKEAGATHFGSVYCAEAPVCAQTINFYKAGSRATGLNFAGGVAVSASAPSFTAPCVDLMSKGVDYIELDLAPATTVSVVKACLQQGYKGTFGLVTVAMVPKIFEAVEGAQFAGPLSAFPWWVDSPATKPMQDAMKEYAPSLDYRTNATSAVWVTLEVFREAANKVTGEVTPTSLSAAYKTISNETLGGLLPQPVSFTDGHGPSINCFWLYRYTAGDAQPSLLSQSGTSGNGQTGDLASTCAS